MPAGCCMLWMVAVLMVLYSQVLRFSFCTLSCCNISGVFKTQSSWHNRAYFAKIVNGKKVSSLTFDLVLNTTSTLPCCTLFRLYKFRIALFSCWTFSHVTIIPCLTFLMQYFHNLLNFFCCFLTILPFFLLACFLCCTSSPYYIILFWFWSLLCWTIFR